jgi:hypothetical protein
MRALEVLFQQEGRQQYGVPILSIFLTDGQSKYPNDTVNAANHLHENLTEVGLSCLIIGVIRLTM